MVASGGLISLGVSIAAMIGTGMIARSIPYEEGFGKKQLAWMAHCAGLATNSILICLLFVKKSIALSMQLKDPTRSLILVANP